MIVDLNISKQNYNIKFIFKCRVNLLSYKVL